MVRRASKKKKDKPTREVRKVILVSAEGVNKTERTYFAEFNRLQKDYHIVFATGNSTDPVNIVSEAIDGVTKNGLNLKQGDIACAVFDVDFGKERKINEARQIAKKAGVRLILSNPCFEVWLLQHFRHSTRGYLSNEAVIDDLLGCWPEYRKSIGSYQNIVDKTYNAIENAGKLRAYHDSLYASVNTEERNPSTDVDELIRTILNLTHEKEG